MNNERFCSKCDKRVKITKATCYPCYLEMGKVYRQNRNAEMLGLPATLTLDQWFHMLEHFQGQCAYCGKLQRIIVIEHFIPLLLGGGTTIQNCVPSCTDCNARKRDLHPDQVTKIPREYIERVRVFLSQQKS